MAKVKKAIEASLPAPPTTRRKAPKSIADRLGLSLPTVPTEPYQNLEDYTYMIHGDPGVGKTTLACQFPGAVLFSFEPGGTSLRIKRRDVPTWEHMLGYVDLMCNRAESEHITAIIDTGYMAYERAFEHMLKELGIVEPRDKGFGAFWKFLDSAFRDMHFRLRQSAVSLVIIAHSEEREIKKTINGQEITTDVKFKMQLGAQATRLYNAICDVVGYYQKDSNGNRTLAITDTEHADGKQRIKGHFLDQNGNALEYIPMGKSEEVAFSNFNKAFHNKFKVAKKR